MSERPTQGNDGSCLICQDKNWRLVVRSEDVEYHCKPGTFDVVACVSCGHHYVHPLPSYEEIASIYPTTYYTVNKKSPLWLDGWFYEKKLAADAHKLRNSLRQFNIRSIVDVGSGEVSRLAQFKDAFGGGVEAIAFDLQFNDSIVEDARKADIRLITGNVETDVSRLEDNGHDLIVMRQLVEHLRDPKLAIANLARKLAPGGLMIIDTPNRGGLDYELFKKQHWGGYHIPRHFHLFTQPKLVKIIEDAGLKIHSKGYIPSMGFWIISLRNKLGLNSMAAGDSFWEFLRYKNLFVSGSFIAFDTLRVKLGLQTSNQFVWAQKPK